MGKPAVAPLVAALKDQDPGVRERAASALGEIKDPHAIEPLISALDDPDSHVEKGASDALVKIGRPAVEPLITALKDGDAGVRSRAASALGEIKDARAIEALIAALEDGNVEVRRDSAYDLAVLKDPRAIAPLITSLKDADSDVRWRAASALVEIGPSAVEPLIAALSNANSDVRCGASYALGRLGNPRGVAALLAAWKKLDLPVIAGAYGFFIEKGEPGSEGILIRALNAFGSKIMVSGKPVMAEDFLNCGNQRLESAAADWAYAHGYGATRKSGWRTVESGEKR